MPYLTPDTPPDETVCFQVIIPNDIAWVGIFKGAVSELIKAYNFEEFGTYTPEQTAQKFLSIYDDMVFSECDMGCCYDIVLRRITSDGDMEISINGGDWIPDPDDPRVSAPLYPPPVFDEHHTKCDAATNVSEHLNDVIQETSDQLGGAGSLVEIASAIALAIFALFLAPESIPALVPLILPIISAVLFLGQAAFDAYFDSDAHDKILCAIYCSIGDDGTFTDAEYADLLAQLASDLPASPAKDYFIQIVGRIGLVGMNDYAAVGTSADADCSDCDCFDPCDLHGWTIWDGASPTYGSDENGEYVDITSVSDIPLVGGQAVGMSSGADADCCPIYYEVQSGSIGGALSSHEGEPRYPTAGSIGHVGIPVPPDNCSPSFVFYSTVSFVIRIRFTPFP